MAATTSDYLKLHFLIFIWGFTAILGLLVKIPAIEMVIFRTLIATVGMGALIVFRKQSFKLPARSLLWVILTGFVVSAHWITFFGSARVSNASVSLVGFATASLWAAIIEPIMNKSKIKGYEVALGLVVISGLYIIFSFDFHYPLGLFLGILSGFFSSLFFTFNQRLGKKIGTFQITFYEMLGAFIGTSLYLVFHVTVVNPDYPVNFNASLTDWMWILVLGLVCTVYAFSASVSLTKRLSVFFMQLNINLEPVYGIILAVLIFGKTETMNLQFYMGTFIILMAVAAYPLLKRKFNPDPLTEIQK